MSSGAARRCRERSRSSGSSSRRADRLTTQDRIHERRLACHARPATPSRRGCWTPAHGPPATTNPRTSEERHLRRRACFIETHDTRRARSPRPTAHETAHSWPQTRHLPNAVPLAQGGNHIREIRGRPTGVPSTSGSTRLTCSGQRAVPSILGGPLCDIGLVVAPRISVHANRTQR